MVLLRWSPIWPDFAFGRLCVWSKCQTWSHLSNARIGGFSWGSDLQLDYKTQGGTKIILESKSLSSTSFSSWPLLWVTLIDVGGLIPEHHIGRNPLLTPETRWQDNCCLSQPLYHRLSTQSSPSTSHCWSLMVVTHSSWPSQSIHQGQYCYHSNEHKQNPTFEKR